MAEPVLQPQREAAFPVFSGLQHHGRVGHAQMVVLGLGRALRVQDTPMVVCEARRKRAAFIHGGKHRAAKAIVRFPHFVPEAADALPPELTDAAVALDFVAVVAGRRRERLMEHRFAARGEAHRITDLVLRAVGVENRHLIVGHAHGLPPIDHGDAPDIQLRLLLGHRHGVVEIHEAVGVQLLHQPEAEAEIAPPGAVAPQGPDGHAGMGHAVAQHFHALRAVALRLRGGALRTLDPLPHLLEGGALLHVKAQFVAQAQARFAVRVKQAAQIVHVRVLKGSKLAGQVAPFAGERLAVIDALQLQRAPVPEYFRVFPPEFGKADLLLDRFQNRIPAPQREQKGVQRRVLRVPRKQRGMLGHRKIRNRGHGLIQADVPASLQPAAGRKQRSLQRVPWLRSFQRDRDAQGGLRAPQARAHRALRKVRFRHLHQPQPAQDTRRLVRAEHVLAAR